MTKIATRTFTPTAQEALLHHLEKDDAPCQIQAVWILGQHGSIVAVQPLKSLIDGFFVAPRLRKAVQQAIGEIQSRSVLEPGGLSLARPAGGELTEARGDEGGLSPPDTEN